MPFRKLCLTVAATLLALGAAAAADVADLRIHGFISQGWLRTTGTDWYGDTRDQGSFEFTEAALNVSAQPLDGLRLGMQLLARDFGDSGDAQVEIDWAFADYRLAARTGVKAGRFKMPYGLYNESRDIDFDHPTVFLPMVVYLPQLRDYTLALNGAMAYAGVDAGRLGQFDGAAFAGGQNLREEGDLANYLRDLGSGDEFSSIGLEAIVGGVVTWQTPLDGLRLRGSIASFWGFESVGSRRDVPVPGQSGVFADLDITNRIDSFFSGVISIEYQREGLTLATEWLREYGANDSHVASQPYTNVPAAGVPGGTVRVNLPGVTTNERTHSLTEAAYAAASYRILDRLELSASRQVRFANRENRGNRFDRSWALAARYDILGNWLVKAEWQHHRGYELDTGNDRPDTWTLFALKTTVDF